MKKVRYYILIIGLLVSSSAFSQKWKLSRSEVGGGIGIANYFGDIGGAEQSKMLGFGDIDLENTRFSFSGFYRYRIYERFSIKGGLNYARIHGADKNSANEGRNYAFSTNLYELYGQVEYHITEEKQMVTYNAMSLRGKLKKMNADINFYAFLGIGGSYFKSTPLESFETSTRYVGDKNMSLIVPVGLGLKYPLSPKTSLGLEVGRRFTLTDYIDGFSPEQSESRDTYYFTVINVSYKLERKAKRPEYRF